MYLASGDSFADHWIDVVLTALLAALGYFIVDRLRALDACDQRAEEKFEKINQQLAEFKAKIAVVESFVRNGRISAE